MENTTTPQRKAARWGVWEEWVNILSHRKSVDESSGFFIPVLKTASLFAWVAGGTETTRHTMYWLLKYMAMYPEVQVKVHKEIDDVLGRF